MTSVQKLKRLKSIKRKYNNTTKKLAYIRNKIKYLIKKDGITLDESTHDDLRNTLLEKNTAIKGNAFQKIFWSQQLQASRLKNSKQMKWHPLLIKWALYLRHQSSKSYETLRESKCIHLPSQRTLRDYTHFIQNNVGFSNEHDEELIKSAQLESKEEFQRCIIITFDEMYVKEDLVFNKNTGSLVNLGNIR